MRAGDFEAAWRETDRAEAARRARGWRDEAAGDLMWDGTPLAGKSVLIRCLHGLGDTLQFMRFVPEVCRIARQVRFAVQPVLLPLFAGHPHFGEVINGWSDHWPPHDVEIEVMELAYALRATADQVGSFVGSLSSDQIRKTSRWSHPPTANGPLRVGLVWRSSDWDHSRSLPPELLGFLAVEGVSFHSLQQGVSDDAVRNLPLPVLPLASGTADPLDAAAAMLWLDLIISVDSMPAHLAGSLRRPVWLLLKKDADWRWMERRSDSPWYPTMRLFRETSNGWREVISNVSAELKRLKENQGNQGVLPKR